MLYIKSYPPRLRFFCCKFNLDLLPLDRRNKNIKSENILLLRLPPPPCELLMLVVEVLSIEILAPSRFFNTSITGFREES